MRTTALLATVASCAGRGMLAGAVGTAAMTVSSTLEAKLRQRGASSTPADVAGTVLGVEPAGDSGRFETIVHWGYGTAWGAARGLIGATGLSGPVAAAAHMAAVWGAEQAVLPATGTAPPAWRWGAKEIGVDLFHHAVYALVTSAVYDRLDAAAGETCRS
ncbi:hypothetical protein [Nocardiopsis sp. NRRL B-16309]|uniref:hypothetical protein n=1 Tax=Nocardiopsis sp. NRRL B-16309 TaxID=1519494 RepID=UPI0006AE5CB5|nr:hypothetical protein [Nocardiopsis sp. NRRL B-16309]KOX07905.1 hypothetical protein ADL05_28420 [Nocardiopsis sp. NRRL B-16309]